MQQIADWLESLGMSEYTQGFAENSIDISVLRDLTDQDPKDLSVVLGDRRKMPRAITEPDGAPPAAPAAATPHAGSAAGRDHRVSAYLKHTRGCWRASLSDADVLLAIRRPECSSQCRNLPDAVILINSGVLRNPERKRR